MTRVSSGGLNVIAATYDFAADPEFEGVGVATSHITGEKINRFTHIHQNMEDLLAKQKMTRLYCQEVGGCIQRCMGIDALNALSIASYEADQKHGTSYNKNFIEFMKKVQKEDLALVCAQTDVKGNRDLAPGQAERSRTSTCASWKKGPTASSSTAPRRIIPAPPTRTRSSSCRPGTWSRTKRTGPWPSPCPPMRRASC